MSEVKLNGINAIIFMQEDKLKVTYLHILITVIFSCIGWPLFLYGFIKSNILLTLLGGVICSLPLFIYMVKAGGFIAFFKDITSELPEQPDNEAADSNSIKCFLKWTLTVITGAILALFIGCFLTLVFLILIAMKYIRLYSQMREKPSFIESAFPVLITGILVYFGNCFIILI